MAELLLLVGNVAIHRFELDKAEILIGRSRQCDILITDGSVSSRHAKLHCEFDDHNTVESVVLEDLGSTNGSQVNDQFIQRHPVQHDDVISIGSARLQLMLKELSDSTTRVKHEDHHELRDKLDQVSLDELTGREREVFALIGQGRQRKEIAREMNLSVHTVSDYLKVIYRKLNISSKQEAVLFYKYLKR